MNTIPKRHSISKLPMHRPERILFEIARYIQLSKIEQMDENYVCGFIYNCIENMNVATREELEEFVVNCLSSANKATFHIEDY